MSTGQVEEVRELLKRVPEKHARLLKTESILRSVDIVTDTEGFLSRLQAMNVDEGADRKQWLMDPKALVTMFQSKEGLGKAKFA